MISTCIFNLGKAGTTSIVPMGLMMNSSWGVWVQLKYLHE